MFLRGGASFVAVTKERGILVYRLVHKYHHTWISGRINIPGATLETSSVLRAPRNESRKTVCRSYEICNLLPLRTVESPCGLHRNTPEHKAVQHVAESDTEF